MGKKQSKEQSHGHGHGRHHEQAPKDGRSRMHRYIRDRVVGSKWFGRFVMFVIIINSLLLWPWTDKAKQHGRLPAYDVYPLINNLFIIVYLAEFILKVCVKIFDLRLHPLYVLC